MLGAMAYYSSNYTYYIYHNRFIIPYPLEKSADFGIIGGYFERHNYIICLLCAGCVMFVHLIINRKINTDKGKYIISEIIPAIAYAHE